MVAEENRRRGGNGCWQGRQALTSGMLQQGLATAVRIALLAQPSSCSCCAMKSWTSHWSRH